MSCDHILQKLNILPSFEISRRISDDELKKIKDNVKKLNLRGQKKTEEFDRELDKFTQDILKKEPVPGILNKTIISSQKTQELLKFSIYLGKEIKKLKLTKEEESFMIVSLVKLLELSITDFNKWTQKQQEIDEDEENLEGEDEV
jgi:hypothetical protein